MAQSFDAVAFWDRHGKTVYADQINALQCTKSEITAEAGRDGHACPFVQEQVRKLDAEIEAIRERAQDRYSDLASDPLP